MGSGESAEHAMTLVLLILAEDLLALDWRKTLTIAWSPLKYQEVKVEKIIGTQPSTRSVCAYFAFWMIVIGALTLGIHSPYIAALPLAVILLEVPTVLGNRKLFNAWW